MKSLIVLVLFIIPLAAADIEFHDGCVIKNITIIKYESRELIIQKANHKFVNILFPHVKNIIKSEIDHTQSSTMDNCKNPKMLKSWEEEYSGDLANELGKTKHRPRLKMLTVSVISLALAFDYFKQSDEISTSINNLKASDLDADVSDLKSTKNRKLFMSGIFVIVCIFNTIYSLETVEIQSNNSTVGISYKF